MIQASQLKNIREKGFFYEMKSNNICHALLLATKTQSNNFLIKTYKINIAVPLQYLMNLSNISQNCIK